MKQVTHLARTYGQALYEVGKQEKCLKNLLTDLTDFLALLDKEPLLFKALSSPVTPAKELWQLLDELPFSLSPFLLNFVKILIRNKRFSLLQEVCTDLEERWQKDQRIRVVHLTTARPLNAKREHAFQEKLMDFYQQDISLKKQVDPSLYAGFTISSQGVHIDGSIKGHLNKMMKQLKGTAAQ